MITNFNQYNESLIDKMTPKSDEEIRQKLDGLPVLNKLKIGINRNLIWLVEESLKTIKEMYYDPQMAIDEYIKVNYISGLKTVIEYQNLEMVKLFLKYDINAIKVDHLDNAWNHVYYYDQISNEEAIKRRKTAKDITKLLYANQGLKKKLKWKERKYFKGTKFQHYNMQLGIDESLTDKMTPKSEDEIANHMKMAYRYFRERSLKEDFIKESDKKRVEDFWVWHSKEIDELLFDGWTKKDIYDEFTPRLYDHFEDEEEDSAEEDYYSSF